MNKLLKKIIAVFLLTCLINSQLSAIGMYGVAYAMSKNEIANQNSRTQDSNVEFNAYFKGGVHEITEKMGNTVKIYINIKLNNTGYLEKGVISFQNTNFTIDKSVKDENIKSVDIENNKILLNKINGEADINIEIPVNILNADEVAIDNFSKEIQTIFTATYINSNAKEKNICKEIINVLSWDTLTDNEITAKIETDTTKYIIYDNEEKKEIILQVKVNSAIKDNIVPIQETQINIQVPEINNIKPTNVYVIANQTKATNGKQNGLNFNNNNYEYNTETGKLTINTKNLNDKISWLKNVQDEYLVTFVYANNSIYDYVVENGINVNFKINNNIKIYGSQEAIIKSEQIDKTINLNEMLGELVDYSINTDSSISKGQIYANYDAKNKKETIYNVVYNAIICTADLTDPIKFEQQIDQFVTNGNYKNATTVAGENYTYNKKIKISKDIFEKILGEEGKIEIYDTKETKIGTINKTSNLENENYVLDISTLNNNQLNIITSKPISEGQLTINIEKAIKQNIDYTKQQFQTFNKLTTQVNNKLSEITLTEPKTVVEIEINKKDLTTVMENENVEIRAILDTSTINNALHKNTTLKIKLPEYISKLKINSYDILMANSLEIETIKPVKENGQIVINVQLKGTQTEYTIDAEYKGTIIIFNTNLTTKNITPSSESKITMEYENYNDTTLNKKGTVETKINFVAPQGVITANGISNYAQNAKELLVISNEGATGTIETYAEKITATVKQKIINNYGNKIKDIVILGRIPVKGNKEIDTGKDLGSTFSTKLTGKIKITGLEESQYTVYYSKNLNATKDLNNEENNWSTEQSNSTNSYLIIINNYEMKPGEILEVEYNTEIPENISHNNTVNGEYKVYYTNVSSIGEFVESKISPVVTLETGEGPELSIDLKTTTNTVREGQIVRITATIKNIGTVTAKNVKLNVEAPDGTLHTAIEEGDKQYTESTEKIKTILIGDLAVGETVTKDYELKINKGTKTVTEVDEETGESETYEENVYPGDKQIECNANLTADELTNSIKAETCKLTVLEGDLEIVNTPSVYEDGTLIKDETFKFVVKIKNISNSKNLENVTFNMNIPQGIEITNVYYSDNKNFKEKNKENITINNNSITVNIGKLESFYAQLGLDTDEDDIEDDEENEGFEEGIEIAEIRECTYICIELKVNQFTGELIAYATAKADGIQEHYSNIKKFNVEEVKLSIQQETDSKYVKEGKEFTYKYVIENIGNISPKKSNFTMQIPEELSFVKAEYSNNGEDYTVKVVKNNTLQITLLDIPAGEKVNIIVTVKANLLPDKNDKTITSYATLNELESNKVNVIIEYDSNAHIIYDDEEETEDKPTTNATYKITGTAWLDGNKNGSREETEDLLQNIKVMLVYRKTNKIVKDSKTNAEKITTTNNLGQYEFNNLLPDEYLVVFDYGSGTYSITEYKKTGVNETINSDVIDITMTLNGAKTIVAISDIIKITDTNIRDIDIGLYVSEKFDLKLDKYITKITRTTPTSGTETFEYNDVQNTKIEVLRQNLGSSSIVIEYKIVVTNEGGVAGYVKKIADYLPNEVLFKTELNNDWYLAKDGNIYNTSLENTIINPGESKEVTLILLKQITEDSLGILNNNAEIYESYNEQGLKDIDSTAANKQEEEDDMSKADIILSVVTGAQITLYVTIALTVVIMLGFGIFEIKKRVLNKKY